ncbi:MAG: hypothetical protein GY950_17330, partial [bacterium]|nr:hypothetical protein [bacterium]
GLDTTKAPLQQQAAFLNYQVREVKTYLPQKKLGKLFKETVVLSQQMAKEFETVQRAVVKSGVSNEVDDYVNDLRPLMTVETVGSQSYIFPDVDWFQSKSSPRTVEYQFFNLARSGWCVGSRLCNTRKVDQEESQQLLVQWQALQPQLDGVFKQVATQTIDRLKKE